MFRRILFLIFILLFSFSVEAQVNTDFNANQNSGCPNPFLLIMSSTSTSGGAAIDNYSWTLTGPAGFTTQTSNTNQLSTTLTIPGFYTVVLTACAGADCDTETKTNFIEVFARPTVAATLTSLTGCPPHQVCLDGTFTAECGTITSSVVDMKDGTVYTDVEDFCHSYVNSGTYNNITVSATNSCGCINTITLPQTISVSPAPTASFTSTNNFSCNAPLNVTFTSNSTNVVAGSTYEWNIPPFVNGATGTSVTQSFPAGNYDVELIVVNPNGCSDTSYQTSFVSVGNPSAGMSASDSVVCVNQGFVAFTDISSGTPNSWSWIFEGHGTSNNQNTARNFNTVGSWDVSLVVGYAQGCTDSIFMPDFITVNPRPVTDFTVTDSSSCSAPFTTTFTNTTLNSDVVNWTFPGGTPGTFVGNGPVNVTYNAGGNYNVVLNVTNIEGCTKNTTYNNVINVEPLTVSLDIDSTEGCIPLTATLGFTLSGGEIAANQTWTLPGSDIGSSTATNPVAEYTAVGCNDVTLNVSTVSGCNTSLTVPNAICAGTPPTGAFAIAPTAICFESEDVEVSFNGFGADSILWDFGDSEPPVWASPGTVVAHSYSDDLGSYTVTMMAFNNGCPGDTAEYVDTVEILGPISAFNSSMESCVDWNTFNFMDDSEQADSMFYTFGDPTTNLDTSSLLNPQWTYPAIDSVKTYAVTQYTYNFTTGCEHSVTNTITVYPPNASFVANNLEGCAPFSTTFQNISLFPGVSNLTLWNWDSTYVFSGPNVHTVWDNHRTRNKTYSTPGVYDVIMINEDPRGCQDTALIEDYITVHGVDASFSMSDSSGCAPIVVNFTDLSQAPITGVASWFWNFGDTSTLADTAITINPSYNYTQAGIYTVSLTAIDSFGCTDVFTNQIEIHKAFANFSLSENFVCTNQPVAIIDSSTGNGLSYDWQFANGSPASSNVFNPTPVSFATEGFHNIFLEVTDSVGCTDDTTFALPVFDVVAAAQASVDTITCFANVIPVVFTNSSINNVDSSSVWWDLGNGTTSTLYTPSAVYNVAGNYVVSMSVSSNSGCRDTVIVDTIFVGGPYAQIRVLNRDTACICETIDFEITTWNASSPTFISGDGGVITYVPNGIAGDTILDTLSYQYCQTGSFQPQVFIDDGTCSGNVLLDDTIRIDSLITGFGFDPITACDSGTVCFYDSSYNFVQGSVGIASYIWDFGDGDTSMLQNPCHNFLTPGFHTVTLSVLSNYNCRDTVVQQLYIPASPVVNILPSDSNGCIGLNITFFDSSTVDSMTIIDTWNWDFGNGSTATTQNGTTTYNTSGFFNTTLTVTDTFGCTATDSVEIEVFALPNILAGLDALICKNDSVQISASGGVTYAWSPNYNIVDSAVASPIVYPMVDTNYIVEGRDINGCPNWDTLFVDVNEIDAFFSAPSVCLNDTSSFVDLSTSDGTINFWGWNFGEPTSGVDDTSNLQNPDHFYSSNGTFNVTLNITDDNGCMDDTLVQVFVSQAPVASFIADSVCLGLPTSFNSSGTNNGGANILQYEWNFGVAGVVTDTSNLQNPTFTYPAPGLYTVNFSVLTDQTCVGNNDDTSFVIEVFALPTVSAGQDSILCLGDSMQLNASGAMTYAWTQNYNITDTSIANPIVFPAVDTAYVVHGIDTNNCMNLDTIAITVNSLQANFSATSACLGSATNFTDLSQATGTLTNWNWTFDEPISGANDSSTLQNPTHTYLTPDTFSVVLTIEDNNQCMSDTVIEVVVEDIAFASFTGDSVCFGNATSFNSSASDGGDGTITNYSWNFGTGVLADTSNNPNPSFTYDAPGAYTVCLQVTTDQLCANNFDDTCFTIEVFEIPTVDFTVDSACLGNAHTFTDLSQAGVHSGIFTSTWNFGQNLADTLQINGSPASTQFTYDSTGQYNVTLLVVDSNSCQSSASETVFLFDNPSVDFSFVSACQNQANDFVSLPNPANSNSLTYYWDFDEGAGYTLGDSLQDFTFTLAGNHDVSHVIVDAFGCSDTVQQIINITNAPVAVITGDSTVCRGYSTTLSGANSTVSVLPAVYDWSVTTSQTSTITYSPNTDTRVFLVVTDGNGCFDSTSVLVDVLERPDVDFDWTDACEDIATNITSTTVPGTGAITTYQWNINSNNSGSASFNTQDVSYTVTSLDTLSVSLIVTDDNGCIDSLNQVIIVDEQVDVDVLVTDYLVCPGVGVVVDLNDTTQFAVSGLGDVLWSPPSGVSNINSDSVLLTPNQTTVYTVTAFSTLNQCPPDDDNALTVTVAPEPFITVDAVPNPVLVGAISNVTAGVSPYNFNTDSLNWDNSSGTLNTDFGFNLEATPIEETTYPLQLVYYYDSLRCVKDTSITIFVITECNGEIIYVPNIFTPNDDSKNDEFKITGYGIEVINYLRVFDRWGQLLFEGNDIALSNGRMSAGTGWLGDNKGGVECNSGVYVYTYELICANGDIVRGSGNITLIK